MSEPIGYHVRAALRDGPPGEPSELEKLAAMLLCEVGRVWDPRLADVRPIEVRDALKRGARTFDAKAEPLTDEQVRAVLAEYFGGPPGGAATDINRSTGHPNSCRCEKCEEFDRRAIEHARKILDDAGMCTCREYGEGPLVCPVHGT